MIQSNVDFLFKKTWELDNAIGDLMVKRGDEEIGNVIQRCRRMGLNSKRRWNLLSSTWRGSIILQ